MKKRFYNLEIKIKNKLEEIPVPIISDAAIATGVVGEGKLIPLLILDTSQRPDIEDLINMHADSPSGDANSSWGHINKRSKDTITLILSFKRPIELIICLEFNIASQGFVVDLILHSEALYIQSGVLGDRLSQTMNVAKIIIEVPQTGFEYHWDEMWKKSLIKNFKKRGLSRKEAKLAVKDLMESKRGFYKHRMSCI